MINLKNMQTKNSNGARKNLFKISFTFLLVLVAVFPFVASAQPISCEIDPTSVYCQAQNYKPMAPGCPPDGLYKLICNVQEILGSVVPVLVALGIVYFVYGVVMYVIASDEEAKKGGKDRIIFGIIGLAVIISVWGLVHLVTTTFISSDGNNAPSRTDLNNLLPQ